ncbi:MAG TPA: RagB/SusD family nutrient uptake outer membrane protein [Chitinophagaceae bacterium]|nr:RagB/SusD family nutrient uptake outer membrane protein [Chitinophagaceae bacterium]
MKGSIYIKIALFGLLFAGCKKQLDQQPISDLSSELFWKTAEHALAGNAAIYDGVQKTFSSNGSFTEWGDARSDNFTYGGTGENQINIVLNGLNATTGSTNWNNLYVTIARANFAIKYLPGIPDLTEVQRNNYLAQAYGLRAYMYFWAVRLWGAVPVRLVPYEQIEEDPNLPRSPADSVINGVIIPDLVKASNLADKTATSVFELNYGGILSILTDVYLWQKYYGKVISTTDQLIALNKYALTPSTPNFTAYKDLFVTGSSKENIWTLNWDYLVDGGNGIGGKIGSSDQTSNYYIDSIPLMKWETNKADIRRGINYDTTIANALQRIIQVWKYYPFDGNGKPVTPSRAQNQARFPLYRWADILLMRAEALNWGNNDIAGATAIVNQIRARVKAGPLNAANYNNLASQLDMESAILDERQLELFAEGKRWFDLERTGRVLSVMNPLIIQRQKNLGIGQTGFTDARKILWPVSRDALTRDPLLVQNPPYSD